MSNIPFLYRVSKTATLTSEDLKVNPKGDEGPLTNRQIDANFNSLLNAIDSKADLVDPVFPEKSVVNTGLGYLVIPVFTDDDVPTELQDKTLRQKILQNGSFRFNPDSNTIETYIGTYEEGAWQSLTAKAAGGANNSIFWLNDQKVISDYEIPSGKNAMTAGPITVNRGVAVSIPEGCTWTIV